MNKVQCKLLCYIQHLEAVEVDYRYQDLPRAFAQLIVFLPKDAQGCYLAGDALMEHLATQAPPREWFETQEAKLSATMTAVQALPPELQALAPIKQTYDALKWFEDANVQAAQIINGEWVRPSVAVDMRAPQNLPMLKLRLLAEVARVRWQYETGGIVINGARVLTDRESQATVTGAYARAMQDGATTIQWKAENGFVTLDAAAIMQTGAAVFDHVQRCFAREGELREQIEAAGTLDALLRIDIQAGWGR